MQLHIHLNNHIKKKYIYIYIYIVIYYNTTGFREAAPRADGGSFAPAPGAAHPGLCGLLGLL